jgi:tetraacyldisaccharide-1-P 4'-kinase
LLARAEAAHLVLLTTEKDIARLSGDPRLNALAMRATALPVRLVIEERDAFAKMILSVMKR